MSQKTETKDTKQPKDKKVRVFFPNVITGRASIITTWDKSYKTAAGVGPCSTIDDVKAAYGSALEPDRSGTIGKSHFVYDLGKDLVFATPGTSGHPSKVVTAVGLFNGGVGFVANHFVAALNDFVPTLPRRQST